MVKVYAVTLAVGILGILWIVLGGALADNLGRPDRDPGVKLGARGRVVIGSLTGFGMAGMSAEFAPIDFTWQVSLLLAAVAAVAAGFWARYSVPDPSASS